MKYLNCGKAFLGGFFATLVFHQGLYAAFYALGILPNPPFNLAPTQPFGVPAVFSLAFFGGLWGVALWPALRLSEGRKFWLKAIVLGAVGPTLVAFAIVFPLKGMAFNPLLIPFGLLLNGAWGLGLGLFLKFTQARGLNS